MRPVAFEMRSYIVDASERMVTVLITAYKEKNTIGRAVESFVDPKRNTIRDIEILIVCPDGPTWRAARKTADRFKFESIRTIHDPGKGKPVALNIGFKEAKGELIFLTDGDVYVEDHALEKLLPHFERENVGGVTGRPISADEKNTMMGYYGHLLADAAHHKRMVTMNPGSEGIGKKITRTAPNFFVMSGYVSMIRNTHPVIPDDTLVDDAYLSYAISNRGEQIVYEPQAIAYIKYPTTIRDWYRQKLRSLGGYVQLWEFNIVTPKTRTRSFGAELKYFWFPLAYALKEGSILQKMVRLWWSLLLYPLRLWLWIRIWWERKIKKKNFKETWVRVESTK